MDSRIFKSTDNDKVICGLCSHKCTVLPKQFGKCKTRYNESGVLKSLSYGRLIATALDPVEKKPLFHYKPGTLTYSVASPGCNLTCPFCQNHSISYLEREFSFKSIPFVSPKELTDRAIKCKAKSISFTYSEPILMMEYAQDTAAIASTLGIDIIYVTNGQASNNAAEALSDFVTAANVDIKSFSKTNYQQILGGNLKATLNTIETLLKNNVWVEITTLLIPDFNDTNAEIESIAKYIAQLDINIPWHISAFRPGNKWTHLPSTAKETLIKAREIAKAAGLNFVYTGNVMNQEGETTYCPSCNLDIIKRRGYRVIETKITDSTCNRCKTKVAGIWVS